MSTLVYAIDADPNSKWKTYALSALVTATNDALNGTIDPAWAGRMIPTCLTTNRADAIPSTFGQLCDAADDTQWDARSLFTVDSAHPARGTLLAFTAFQALLSAPPYTNAVVALVGVGGTGAVHSPSLTGSGRVTLAGVGGTGHVGTLAPQQYQEPVGSTFYTQNTFSNSDPASPPAGWDYVQNVAGTSRQSDASAPLSPAFVQRIPYNFGWTGGNSVSRTGYDLAGAQSKRGLYGRYAPKPSSNFQGHPGSFINKLTYVYFPVPGPNIPRCDISFQMWGGGTDPLYFGLVMQNLFGLYPDSYGNLGHTVGRIQNVPGAQVEVNRGVFGIMQFIVRGNSAGNADGSIVTYLNGQMLHNLQGIPFTSAGTNPDRAEWNAIWGGIDGMPTENFYIDIDDFYLSGHD